MSLVLTSDGTDRLGINSGEIEETHTCSCDSCCYSDYSTVYQSHQLFANGDEKVSRNSMHDKMLSSLEDITKNVTCDATWFIPQKSSNGSISCECGSSLEHIIDCDSYSGKVKLRKCYCMTFSIDDSAIVVGLCLYGCISTHIFSPYNPLPSNTSKLNELCSRYHRKGQLCGKCEDGFALPVYSYNLSCVNCEDYASNWVKYLAVSLLPLTLFLIMIVTFRVRITSGLMNAFILVSQIMCLPDLSRQFMLRKIHHTHLTILLSVYSLLGIWNLDFFLILLMCLYPCQWFQKCLNHCRLQSHFLHTFIDAFQGCYKDGTNGSRDCRWFAGLYLFTRILILILLGVTRSFFLFL